MTLMVVSLEFNKTKLSVYNMTANFIFYDHLQCVIATTHKSVQLFYQKVTPSDFSTSTIVVPNAKLHIH